MRVIQQHNNHRTDKIRLFVNYSRNPMRKFIRPTVAVLAASLLLGAVTSSQGSSINARFVGRNNNQFLAPTDVAGIVPKANWVNIDNGAQATPFAGTVVGVTDEAGTITGVNLDYAATDSWVSDGPTVTRNDILMKGTLKCTASPATLTLSGLPLSGVYDLYIYIEEDSVGALGNVTDNTTTYYLEAQNIFAETFIQATVTTPDATVPPPAGAYPIANYVKFAGEKPDGSGNISITVTKDGVANNGMGITGLQLIQVSGPGFPSNSIPAAIVTPPSSLSIPQGADAYFSVETSGPGVQILWKKNNVIIPGATSANLILPTTAADNGAQIVAVAYNNVNSVTSTPPATITFIAPTIPFNKVVGANFIGRNGGNATLTPGGYAGVVPQINWNNIDEGAVNHTGSSQLTEGNGVGTSITLDYAAADSWSSDGPTATPDDILMKGILKATTTTPAKVTLKGLPAGTAYDVYVYTTENGKGALGHMTQGATSYYLEPEDKFSGAFIQATVTTPDPTVPPPALAYPVANYVQFANVSPDASGNILITVTKDGIANDGLGIAGVQIVQITGTGLPTNNAPIAILTDPTSAIVAPGGSATFSASAGPFPKYQWKRNGAAIPGATQSSYTLNNVSAADNGATFTVVANNNISSAASLTATLTVDPAGPYAGHRASISTQPVPVTVVQGRPVTFTEGVTTYPANDAITTQWLKNGAPIAGATALTYNIASAQLGDNGAQIQVTNMTPAGPLSSTTVILKVLADTNAPVPSGGTITSGSSGATQIGVAFDEPIDTTTLIAGNFSIAGVSSTFKLATNSLGNYAAAVLEATLTPGQTYTVNVHNVKDIWGNAITSASFPVTANPNIGWADAGTPIVPSSVIPVGTNGFDVLNGGRTEWANYDEVALVYLKKTNDFDVSVQVIYAEPCSQWGRVGLQARNSLDIGLPRDTTTMSAYAQTHVNPNQTLASSGVWDPADPVQPVNPTPNNGHEQNTRLDTGIATSGWGSPGTSPVYPNVWLRLKRVNDVIYGYRSENGQNWTDQGSVTLTAQQAEMFVGPSFSAETGNIWATAGFDVWGPYDPKFDRLFLAQFRNYGTTPAPQPAVIVPTRVTLAGTIQDPLGKGNLVLTWPAAGVLQQSSTLGATASWSPVIGAPNTGAGGRVEVTPSGSAKYYRLLQQ